MLHEWFHRKSSNLAAALLLVFLLLLTFVVGWTMDRQSMRFTQLAFDAQVTELSQNIELRMRDHEQLLLGAKGLFEASETVSRAEFHHYISTLDISQRYPGIQIVGFTAWVKPDELTQFTQRIRDEGFPQFDIRPAGTRESYSAIIYMEPFANQNVAAFGFDMFSEPARQKAMRAAVATNRASLSEKVILVQERSGYVQAGTLLYLPIYKKNLPTETEAQRWNALLGFVYADSAWAI